VSVIRTVWVIQEGNNDYSSAEQFGEVRFITKGDLRVMDGQQNSGVMADIRRFLSDYLQGVDYIIPVGNPMITVLVAMAIGSGDHRFLKWDGRKVAYLPYTLNQKLVR
jgi:hypothetical protein